MRLGSFAALLVLAPLWCASPFAAYGADPGPVDAGTLVEKLKSEQFEERAAAYEKLAALGEQARAKLESALSSEDSETRNAAGRLLALLGTPGMKLMLYDRNGKPIDGAEANLQIWDASDRYQNERKNTLLHFSADGVAEVRDLKPGLCTLYLTWQKCWIVGETSSYGVSNTNISTALRGGTAPFLFSVTKGGTVKASLHDKEGKPVKEGELALYPVSNFNFDMLETRMDNQSSMRAAGSGSADAQGNITIEGVGDGVYATVSTVSGSSPVEGPTIRVREGQTTQMPPLEVAAKPSGKFVVILRAAVEANAPKASGTSSSSEKQSFIGPLPEPTLLKSTKFTVEEDFLFDGPDAEKKLRKVLIERMRYNRYRRPPQMDTDENGKLTIENLRPGKHRIRIKSDQYAYVTLTVDVPSGGTADSGEVVLDAGGSVSGKVSSADGKQITDLLIYPFLESETSVAEQSPELIAFIRGQQQWEDVRNYMNWQRQFTNRQERNTPDKLSMKNLAPGKYAFIVTRQTIMRVQQVYLICGVNVEAGKTTELPALRFAPPAIATVAAGGSGENQFIKGKVVGPGKEQVVQASVSYQSNQSSTGTSCNSDGVFQIYMSGVGPGGMIRVKAPGYKQAEFDCSLPGVDLSNVEIKLERLRYGGLRLKIVDEEGQPLQGAVVDPAPYQNNNNYYYYYARRMMSIKKSSDAKGEARFAGLSTGLRRIHVIRDGYYLADPARVVIAADTDALLTVMLRKGLTLSGKITGPAGEELSRAVVMLRRMRDNSVCTAGVNAAGEFFIGGLAPDTYSLTAESPLATLRTAQDVELTTDSKSGLALELVRKGGVMVQFEKSMKGRIVYLQDKDADQKKKQGMSQSAIYSLSSRFYAYVDNDGLAEFWNVKPGQYRINAPASTRSNAANEKDAEKYASRIDCGLFSKTFEIKEPKTLAELSAENAVAVKFPEAAASAVAKFVFRANANTAPNPYLQTTQYVIIKGELCTGQYTRAQRYRPASQGGGLASSRLQVIGTLPPYLAPASTGTQTLIQGLVPGKYKILTYTYTYDNNRGTQEQSEEVEIGEFEVAAGERKSLGVIVVEPPKSLKTTITNMRRVQNAENEPPSDEDLDPAFEP